MLDEKQLGHIRHIRNLLNQPPGDWSNMHGRGPAQDDFGALRYQLAFMTYALALAHRHRLPAAPGVFQPLFEKAIEKMLSSDVWIYWRDASRGGAVFNAHLADSLEEMWDPVLRDNIMYSAYVQSMALLHGYLFDDDRYAQPGALTFSHYTPFWGEEHRFEYDRNSLSDHIYWLMAQNGFLGVACEPNCIFQACNQPAILGFRLRDLLEGTSVAEQVVRDYDAAWREFGRLDDRGHYFQMVLEDRRIPSPNRNGAPAGDAFTGALMNMWNRDFVHENYAHQAQAYLVESGEGTLAVTFPGRSAIIPEGRPDVPLENGDFGWMAVWAAEMGDEQTLEELLAHADAYMNPVWSAGALNYPRNDVRSDAEGHRTEIAAIDGNALLPYARLNVPDGMWKLYNVPWEDGHFTRPALTVVDEDIDVSRAFFDAASDRLLFRVRRRGDVAGGGRITISNLDGGGWRMAVSIVSTGGVLDDRESVVRFAVERDAPQWRLALPDQETYEFTVARDEDRTGGRRG